MLPNEIVAKAVKNYDPEWKSKISFERTVEDALDDLVRSIKIDIEKELSGHDIFEKVLEIIKKYDQ